MARWFNTRKAAQIAAFFAREEGGTINVLKLVKLIYLADRECMARYEFSILNDQLVSMNHGPVNSITYNHIKGCGHEQGVWGEFIADRVHHDVSIAQAELSDDQLDELSQAELEVMHDVWAKFGGMTRFQLRNWTHNHCPEWEDPEGSSQRIPYERVFEILGKPAELAEEIKIERRLNSAFS